MIAVRLAAERMHTSIGWLDSRHTFSFGEHQDPRHMGFRALRVINEDRVAPGKGFGTHPHRDMEIVTYVLEGALQHQDSLGTGAIIKPGDVQRMTAGTGVLHSEFNASANDPVHFIQIWLLPERTRLPPSYEQRTFPGPDRTGRLRLVGSHDGREASVTIRQDVDLFAAILPRGSRIVFTLRANRHAWVQIAAGTLTLNGVALSAGDGSSITNEPSLVLESPDTAELLLFDLA